MDAGVLRGDRRGEELAAALGPDRAADTWSWLQDDCQVLKRDRHSLVALGQVAGERCYFKYYRHKSPLHAALVSLGQGRALRAYDRAQILAAAELPVAEPLACLRVAGGLLLITVALAGSDLKALWQERPSIVIEGELMASAGELLALLHRAGFAHGDCKWSNLLWDGKSFYLLDLEGVRKAAPGSSRQARDLARFTVNAEDMGMREEYFHRFLATYASICGLPEKELVQRMLPHVKTLRRRHLARYGHRGGQLL